MIHFDTDYMRGACPEIIQRLADTNLEQTSGYGDDPYTERAKQLILSACGLQDAEVHFMVGGTQTNATVIDGLLSKHKGVMAADNGHINVHEAGAIEACGHKVIVLPSENGKVKAADLEAYIENFYADDTYPHMVAPGMLYISFPTEYGTLYTLDELQSLGSLCRKVGIPLYIDGARLGYGIEAHGNTVSLKDIAACADVFYIGGTKVGALFGEAVVVCNRQLLKNFFPVMKQHGAVLAKGRLLGLQFETLFTDNLYFRLSRNAIERAMEIKQALLAKGYRAYADSPTNQQIFYLPNEKIDELRHNMSFELWGRRGESQTPVRFVTDWSTSKEDTQRLTALL